MLTDAVEQAKLLMTIEHCEVAATATKQPVFLQLQQQLSDLSEQVAAMSFHTFGKHQRRGQVRRCFTQDTFSMLFLPNGLDKMHDDALNAPNLVIYGKIVRRETREGRLYGAATVPKITKPTSSYCDHQQAVTVTTIKSKATVIMGEVGNASVEIMFDSGSAVSLLRKRDMKHMKSLQHVDKHPQITLITASGEPLAVVGHVRTTVLVSGFEVAHKFVLAKHVIYPVTLGIDFLQQNEVVLDFTSIPVDVRHGDKSLNYDQEMKRQCGILKTIPRAGDVQQQLQRIHKPRLLMSAVLW